MNDFKAKALARTAWAFATVDQWYAALAVLTVLMRRRISDFSAQELAEAAWVFATVGQQANSLFATLAGAATPRLGEFTAQNLANAAWSFATVNLLD